MLHTDTPLDSNVNSNMGCPGQPIVADDECIVAGRQASERLKNSGKRLWEDWLLVGKAVERVQGHAMLAAQTNRPEGKRFCQQHADLLRRAGLDWIDKATRSRLLECLKHGEEIDAFLAKLSDAKRSKINHPNSVWRAYQKSTSEPTAPKQSAISELRAENARLRREVESGGGDLWAASDTAKDIAMVIRSKVTPSKAKAIADELKRLAKE